MRCGCDASNQRIPIPVELPKIRYLWSHSRLLVIESESVKVDLDLDLVVARVRHEAPIAAMIHASVTASIRPKEKRNQNDGM